MDKRILIPYWYPVQEKKNRSLIIHSISGIDLGFGDDKVKLKWGLPKKDDQKSLRNSFGISLAAKAPEGVRTLFKYDKTPTDIIAGLAGTYILNHTSYTYKGESSSEKANWINVNADFTRNSVNIFSDDSTYNEALNYNVSFLVSFNHYFNSWNNKLSYLIKRRNLFSLGIGLSHFSNYDDLDDITLRKGFISNNFFTEKETVAGKKGTFERNFGLLLRGSFFYPVSKPISKAYVMLGANVNTYGLASSNFTANGNLGVYISKRKYDEDEGLLTDEFSFGIVADLSALNGFGRTGYWKENFGILLVSQIPLRWK
ncbi:hypothetical protein ig2599ANME_0221 [groundwater metagenome]